MTEKKLSVDNEVQNDDEISTLSGIGKRFGSLVYDFQQEKDFGSIDLQKIIFVLKRAGLECNDFWRGYTDRQIEVESTQE